MSKEDNRKTFRLDTDVAALLKERQEKGNITTETETVNRLLRNIPKQEAELQRQIKTVNEERQQKEEWATRARNAEAELLRIKQAVGVISALFLPAPA
ncbi:hypothetical protein HER32_00225 [Hymenobacter sp. BT18]|uniref:hypothetical protein n=1 Tax=Hymenobacter sp. BT18 TaxID=2835648 RepID=UPI00143ED39A|nr:hypothetical protein [Hymenobacter sp. BT18]QIX59701.1 hypothetical protein HER32_00225 [Hymenobacter sp. BT18]